MANDVLAKMAVLISANNADFNRKFSQSQKTLGTFSKGIGALSGQLKGLIAGFGAIEIGRQIVQTTSEFQKFSAVLTNTLGSDSTAQRALAQIKDFAASTPFSVQELTSSFVKLANQGFVPTTNELRKLGDLAASTGKSFDQLTEAIIDAQVGEFERLKEFGIRAKKEGDKVTFTFKGVKKQVDFTADSIQAYVLSLGDAVGVSGSMDAISKTLGGRISNLGDAWDNLMNTMGNSSSGPLFAVVESLTNIVKALTDFRAEMALVGQALSPFHDLSDVSKQTLDYLLKTSQVSAVIEPFAKQSDIEFVKDYNKNLQQFTDTFLKQGESIEDIRVLWLHYVKSRTAASQADAEANSDKRKAEFDEYIGKLKEQAKAAAAAAKELKDLAAWKVAAAAPLTKDVTKKTGADSLFDSGAMTDALGAFNRIHNALMAVNGDLKINSNEWAIWEANVSARAQILAEKIEMDFAPVIQSALSGIGHALGAALNGSSKLGDSLLKVLGGVLIQLGEMLIAAGLGVEAFKKSLTSLNGFAAIGAGVALIAIGAAVAGSIKRLGENPTGPSPRSISRISANTSIQDSRPQLVTVLKGEDVWIMLQNYQAGKHYTGG